MPAPTPFHVGAYQIRGVVGSGAMGMVYLAHDPAIDRLVAVKTIHRRLLDSSEDEPNVAARFRVEARVAGRLAHRNIVPVYQFGEDDDCAYIVMEYVAGRNLRDYIQSPRKLLVLHVLSLMSQLLDGLHYAHERGVVHRDIKPANLLVSDDGRLKITDFGIARTESSNLTRNSSVIGSPGYIAPEQYIGREVDRRVDVFSSGVLLYQVLSGVTPFAGTDEAIMYKIVYEPHQPLSKVLGDAAFAPFDAVLDRALAKDPAQRYPTAMAMRTALLALSAETVPDVLPPEIVLAPRLEGVEGKPVATGRDTFAAPMPPARPAAPQASMPSAAQAAPKSATRTGPASVPVPTGWDATALAEIERELAQHVGAVARVLVRRAAREATSPGELRHAVAGSINDFEARERFLAKAGVSRAAATVSSGASDFRTTHGGGEAPTGAPLRQGDVDKAATALLASLGPIARVVAKRCAAKSQTREQFIASVLEQLTPNVDARRVQADLWRALG